MTDRSFLRSPLGVVGDTFDGRRFRGIVSAIERTFTAISEAVSKPDFQTRELTSADSPYTVIADFNFYVVDSSGGDVTIQLPQCVTNNSVWVIKTDAANFVTLLPDGSDTINDAPMMRLDAKWDGGLFVCVGTNWVRFMFTYGNPVVVPHVGGLEITGETPTVS